MRIKVVAFDVFGTLTRWPATAVRPVEVQRVLERFGVNISYLAFEAARQCTFYLDCARREVHGYVDFLALVFARMEVKVSLDLIESIAAMYQSRNDMEVFEDAVEAIQAVKASGRVACAFTTLPRFMLGRGGDEILPMLEHYFDISAVGLPKGDRRYYERITGRLGVAPGEILCVGDDPMCDCELPAEAGWRPVLLDRRGRHETDERWPKVVGLRELSQCYSKSREDP